MHEMLYRMHRHRCCRVGDIEDALHPQQLIAMAVEQHRQPDAEPRPIDRFVEAERQRADIVGVAMMIIGRMVMAPSRAEMVKKTIGYFRMATLQSMQSPAGKPSGSGRGSHDDC